MSSFSKSVPVFFDRSNSARKTTITISVTFESSVSQASSPRGDKDFCVQITKEDDPLFLYTSRLSPSAFSSLRQDQNLLVDFSGFPRMFTDLLENIIVEDSKPDPKYNLCFSPESNDQSILEIVEPNKFKRMVHLALKFTAATDQMIKAYLSSALQTNKQRLSSFESHCKSLENDMKRKVMAAQESYKGKAMDLEKTKKKHAEEVAELKRSHANTLIECEERLGKQCRDLFDQHQQSAKSIERLENENKILSEDMDDYKHRMDRLISDNEKYDDTLKEWQDRYAQLERELDEVVVLRRQLDDAEAEVSDLRAQLQRGKDKFTALAKQRDELLDELDKSESQTGFHEKETAKSVQVIGNVMNKLKQEQIKTKTQSDILGKQEERIKELESKLVTLNLNYENDHATSSTVIKENEKLVAEISDLSEKCAMLEKDKSQKDALIRYLNSQLDQMKMGSSQPTLLKPAVMAPGPLSIAPNYTTHVPNNYRPVLGITQPTASTSTPTNYRFSSRFDTAISPIVNENARSALKPAALLEPNLPKPN